MATPGFSGCIIHGCLSQLATYLVRFTKWALFIAFHDPKKLLLPGVLANVWMMTDGLLGHMDAIHVGSSFDFPIAIYLKWEPYGIE